LYPGSEKQLDGWSQEHWERLHQRLFDVSEFMRNLQAAFGRFYNRTYERKGRFWGDRFKSTLLEPGQAVLDCMLYLELNPVRAGLTERPQQYSGNSLYLRTARRGGWLMALKEVLGSEDEESALKRYRALAYYRGGIPSKRFQAAIPERIVAEEEARGFNGNGIFREQLRYFVDGLAVGGEDFVREQLSRLRASGRYLRRVNPIAQRSSQYTSVREQRSHATTN
jgi:hypothetical protein